MRLSPNFTLVELSRSHLAVRLRIVNNPGVHEVAALRRLAETVLEPVREHFGRPVFVSSGFRCPALNEAVGSTPQSQHLRGEAADFEVPGIANVDVARWIAACLDFDQLVLEYWRPNDPAAGWIHCSYVSPHANRRDVLTAGSTGATGGLPFRGVAEAA